MLNQVQEIRNKIFGKKEGDIIDIYHCLMINYGYIPFEEFKKMDAFLVEELINKIVKMNQELNKRGKK